MRAAVLGAGAMGSALVTPLRDAGHDVALWGTWLDGDALDALRRGAPHPGTGVALADGATLFDGRGPDDLAAALDGAEVVFLAVSSSGFVPVLECALPLLPAGAPVAVLTKGFADPAELGAGPGAPVLLPDALRALAGRGGHPEPRVVAVAGPCKANEVAARRPTATVFGSRDAALAAELARALRTDAYRARPSGDEPGVEVCAALKNVYAIALGIADGLTDAAAGDGAAGEPWHDLRAATFAQAVRELVVATDAAGGDPATPVGLAGVGDLEVTGLSGRNKVFGARLGGGERPAAALAAMAAAGKLVEGVPAARSALRRVGERGDDFPLLHALGDLLERDVTPATDAAARGRLVDAVLPE